MKNILRQKWLEKRHLISKERREAASKAIVEALFPLLAEHTLVLSYASLPDEFSTTILNQKLIEKDSLVLPHIFGNDLWLYKVKNLQHLTPGIFDIPQPNPNQCELTYPQNISHVIVPGIAFDSNHHRLGYGKGFYDRFLHQNPHLMTIGIGFTEQFSEEPFPMKPHDIFLQHIVLV